MTKVVCWNINKSKKCCWDELFAMDADVALLQEVGSIPKKLCRKVDIGPGNLHDPCKPGNFDRWTAVVKLSDRVKVEWFKRVLQCSKVAGDEMRVSGVGTIAAARVIPADSDPFIAVSMYARWVSPHVVAKSSSIFSDISAHRIISDISQFIGHRDPSKHRILAAGDLNTIYGATEDNELEIADRARTVFDRMTALGLEFMGPQAPEGGRIAIPRPQGLPEDTKNVPTYYTIRAGSPAKAQNQLDYVFASRGFHRGVRARALNGISRKDWGSSDHCRIVIEVEDC